VTNSAPNSQRALQNLSCLCSRLLNDGRYKLEIVDVLEQPARALQDNIIATPTLIRLSPGPVVRITGNLSNTSLVISALGLEQGLEAEQGDRDE
jgi:circadian clock protein KaiB